MKPTPSTTALLLLLRRRLPSPSNPSSPTPFFARRAMTAPLTQNRSMATNTTPAVIRPSEAEVRDRELSPRNLELAVRHLHADGLVVVEDVVPHADLDALNRKMVEDALHLRSLGDEGPFNYNLGNLQQDPPPVAEHFYKSIFT
ncbi:hypothetical protein LX32DRAFT_658800, partial [Colletotrichum zoysiae]